MKKTQVVTMENSKEVSGLHFTINHTGKMKGMSSLSTSVLCNPYCQTYSKDKDKICSRCYAKTQMRCYTSMQKCMEKNTEILTSEVIPMEKLPLINRTYFRFEAFGDLNNTMQVINYFNICKKNKKVNFALWTKNPALVEAVLESGMKKPKNLQIVLSSHYMNIPADVEKWNFVDKVFTVYDKDYIKEHDIEINCGARSCLACNKCYRKSKEKYINEKVK